jgi:hypothetical protein
MALLLGLFFNSIWLISSFAFGWLLLQLFRLVSLPGWLEISIVMALSFWFGLICMATFIGKGMGESWLECREKAKMMLIVGIPTGEACVVAVVCYLLANQFIADVEIKKYIVAAVTLVFWFVRMEKSNQRLEKQCADAWKGKSSQKK